MQNGIKMQSRKYKTNSCDLGRIKRRLKSRNSLRTLNNNFLILFLIPFFLIKKCNRHFTYSSYSPIFSKTEIPKYFLYVRHTSDVQQHNNQQVMMFYKENIDLSASITSSYSNIII